MGARATRTARFAAVALLLLTPGRSLGQAAAAKPAWFVPQASNTGLAGVSRGIDPRLVGDTAQIIVIAPRRAIQPDPHPQETHDYQPAHSEAASPDFEPSPPKSYCQTAYQTIAGQPATGADMIGMGSGHCD